MLYCSWQLACICLNLCQVCHLVATGSATSLFQKRCPTFGFTGFRFRGRTCHGLLTWRSCLLAATLSSEEATRLSRWKAGWARRGGIRLAARRGIMVGEEVSIALVCVAARCVAAASVLSSKFLCIPVHLSKERAVRGKHNDDFMLRTRKI